MHIQTTQEALYVACEMERNAMQLYQRAMVLLQELGRASEPIFDRIASLYQDEVRHLDMFQALYVGLNVSTEQMLMLSAIASSVLYEGGLMGAVRAGLLNDMESLMNYAISEEQKAVDLYLDFARQCDDESARFTLETIAAEEKRHKESLERQVALETEMQA